MSIAISPDGRFLVVGGWGNIIYVYQLTSDDIDIDTFAEYQIPQSVGCCSIHGIWRIAFSPDSQHLITRSTNGALYVWDTETFTSNHLFLENANNMVWSLEYSQNVTEMVFSVVDDVLEIWDIQEQQELLSFGDIESLPRFTGILNEEDMIIAIFDDGSIKTYNSETGEILNTVSDNFNKVYAFAVLGATNYMVIGLETGEVKVWDMMGDPSLVDIDEFFALN